MKIEEVCKDELQQKVMSSMLQGKGTIYVATNPMPQDEWDGFVSDLADCGIKASQVELKRIPVHHREGVEIMLKRMPGSWILELDPSEAKAAWEMLLGSEEKNNHE